MKFSMIYMILILFAASNCKGQNQNTINVINYETFTRGSSTNYNITSDRVEVISTGLQKREDSISISNNEWEALLKHLQNLKISELNKLEAPSDSRASDAAPHAILSIRKNDTIYKTSSFDHGNAPSAIKPLVQAILRLAENVE